MAILNFLDGQVLVVGITCAGGNCAGESHYPKEEHVRWSPLPPPGHDRPVSPHELKAYKAPRVYSL